jgi:thioesterase domain-containing protein
MGGILSMEMAHQMATAKSRPGRPRFNVVGMVFVDSICPPTHPSLVAKTGPGPSPTVPTPQRIVRSPEEFKAMALPEKVDINLNHARLMVASYELPDWEGQAVPPTILLRCHETVFHGDKVSFVDHCRGMRQLGWEGYSEDNGGFIKTVMDIEGHHFSIFKEENVSRALSLGSPHGMDLGSC